MKYFYGLNSQVLNVHHLLHVADDVKFMKCSLSFITAFPFENPLGKYKSISVLHFIPLHNYVVDFTKKVYYRKSNQTYLPLFSF